MSEKVLPGGPWRNVLGKFRKQAHKISIVARNSRVRNGHGSILNINATTLRNRGKCQRNFFQGVPGGGFQDSSKCEHLPLSVNVNNMLYTQEMSEKVLPGGHWRSFPGKFKSERLPIPVNVNDNTQQGKCQRNVVQGVPGGKF